MDSKIIQRDLNCLWHPCAQMKDYQTFKPIAVAKAKGSYIELADGKQLIDAMSSWWCKSLGHGHPRLKKALREQMEKFEHVILANTTNETIVNLSEKLVGLTETLNKVFYAGDGSCAVEIAMKMSLHSRLISGEPGRNQFMALANGYHGETAGALGVSDVGYFREPYASMLTKVKLLGNIPYVTSMSDPLWDDCSSVWPTIENRLRECATNITAIIVEPIVQGAGGMLLYSQDFLRRLAAWCRDHRVHLIADEIMTGIGRTGLPLACQHANIEPDFVCLSKGLTSGWLPFSAVLTTDAMYDMFYNDYETGHNFLHSHTYCGNALGASVALECLQVMDDERIYQQVQDNAIFMQELMQEVAERTGKLTNIRGIGAMVAADLVVADSGKRVGYAVYQQAVKLGALLRPLGNTVYWLPPLNVSKGTLLDLKEITIAAINAAV